MKKNLYIPRQSGSIRHAKTSISISFFTLFASGFMALISLIFTSIAFIPSEIHPFALLMGAVSALFSICLFVPIQQQHSQTE